MKKHIIIMLCYCLPVYAATHVVTNTNDRGVGSLRQAIIDANADATTPRIINFSIGSGVQVIQPISPLPALTASNITIDGSSQPGWSSGNPVIVLDGVMADFKFDGFVLDGVSNCTIKNMVISNGFLRGISIINNASNNSVLSCLIGINRIGNSVSANSTGIRICALDANTNTGATIGAPNQGNVISGNNHFGIFLSGNVEDATIQGNKIGTDVTGQLSIPNLNAGIAIGMLPINTDTMCSEVSIGGAGMQDGNLIAGNGPTGFGIVTGFQPIEDLTIQGNTLGYNITGTWPLPNAMNIVMVQTVAAIDGLTIQNNIE